jgi:hypothetical protein
MSSASSSPADGGKSSKRFLLGFGLVLGALVIASVVLAIIFGGQAPLRLSEDTPEGVVQAYLTALQEHDFQKAYTYLIPPTDRVGWSYDTWRRGIENYRDPPSWKATLGSVSLKAGEARVEVVLDTFRPGGLFGDPLRSQRLNFILRQQGGSWKIISPVDIWWLD